MNILYAALVLGALSLIFGLALTFAAKAFHVDVDERVEKVRGCLGGANCGACGFAGCDQLAEAVVSGKAAPTACPPAGPKGAKEIGEIMGVAVDGEERKVARVICQGKTGVANESYHYDGYNSCSLAVGIAGGPTKCLYGCVGLGDCMDHCSFGAISIKDGIAYVDESKCTGCGSCVTNCPRHVLELQPVSQTVTVRCHNVEVARKARESCMKACIGCGRCTKECKYDAIHVENGFARIDAGKCTRCGACVSVCPCKCITLGEVME